MKDGYLLVDKPSGPTAHDIVDTVRRSIGLRRVGHTGTLDPFATGLLVVLLGRATRLSQYLVSLRKEYLGTIRLGVTTDSHDLTGSVTSEDDGWQGLERHQIEAAVAEFKGTQLQRPPKYSAVKVGGQRAYRRARRGEQVDLPSRRVEVFDFYLNSVVGADLEFECEVSSGTYVRALARDLGERLGCGAHLRSLRRTSFGRFSVERAHSLADIEANTAAVGPPAEVVAHLSRVSIESEEVRNKVVHGQPVPAVDCEDDVVALIAGHDLVAVAERHGDMLKPRVVLEG